MRFQCGKILGAMREVFMLFDGGGKGGAGGRVGGWAKGGADGLLGRTPRRPQFPRGRMPSRPVPSPFAATSDQTMDVV